MARLAIPHLQPTANSAQLIVKGQPFLMLPAELQNSSLSSADYMSSVWSDLKAANFNTVLGSVSWDAIEPEEGKFDFSELDKIILDARQHGLHLVLLWFGSYKNATSSYVPNWVKSNPIRFTRVQILDNDRRLKATGTISPFCRAAWEADAKAFSTLMRHIKEIDAAHSTVLTTQVENECGVLGDSRDRSELADKAFQQPVPLELLAHLAGKQQLHPEFEKRWPRFRETVDLEHSKTWEQSFGPGNTADEMFMVHALAAYVGKVAQAGKDEYPIPFFANVWLNTDDESILDVDGVPEDLRLGIVAAGGSKPGEYPSGSPCPHTLDLWKYCAPALDFISPDVYLQDYEWVCKQYRYENQPLLIPEQRADGRGSRQAWLAYGSYGALGCSPFGIDTVAAVENEFKKPYGLLAKMSHHILTAQASHPEDMFGFFFDEPSLTARDSWIRSMGNFSLRVERSFTFGKKTPGYGIIIHRGQGRFLLIGEGFQVRFESLNPDTTYAGILEFRELNASPEGQLSEGRRLNGDERMNGDVAMMPSETPDYGGYPIRVTVPSRTCIAECLAYSI
ncbi:glycoside hydrolase superfamily [Fusarium oxysporum Fo47]|uniref:Uncharacterized protein n=1 Tax=Fusarium oxysporum Fo47 TaxID=660027 RepID=W9JHG3_FUSOX|nr:glycoside hydrolase superfamily [Fusarium oxysporum Fo47]EWZ28878.1 hypothetical protein FOZG_17435 [Fusarium oxysporum Fo47]QKD57817.1 glycoside hydrolase superfamily [Fusarium oxysporum Fo47]